MNRRPMLVLSIPHAKSGHRVRGHTYSGRTADSSEDALLKGAKVLISDMDDQDVFEARSRTDDVIAEGLMPIAAMSPADETTGLGEPPAVEGLAWGIAAVEANKTTEIGAGVSIAILDSGIDIDHPTFHGIHRMSEDFRDFTDADPTLLEGCNAVKDEVGHGTHCAAIAVGRDVNGMRLGVAPGVERLIIGRIFRPGASLNALQLRDALDWAIEKRRANIVSLSLSFDPGTYAYQLERDGWPREGAMARAIDEYVETTRFWDGYFTVLNDEANLNQRPGTLVIAAAGNNCLRFRDLTTGEIKQQRAVKPTFPARAKKVVSVGALGYGANGLSVASFSNIAPTLSAPGVSISSAWPSQGGASGLKKLNGTSMACPHVAGLAALWWNRQRARDGRATTAQHVREKLIGSVSDEGLDVAMKTVDVGLGMPQAPREHRS